MKKLLSGSLLIFLLGIAGANAATVNVAETWGSSNVAGWVAYDLINEISVWRAASFSLSTNALKVVFLAQLDSETQLPIMPWPPEEYLIRADGTASGGRFTGDYLSNGVESVSFRIKCDAPVELWLAFGGPSSNRWWQYSLGPQQTGDWHTVKVPVSPSFFKDLWGTQEWSAMRQDLQSISWIGIIVRRNSSLNRQTVLIDDFSLCGPGSEFSAWMAQYGSAGDLSSGRNPLASGDLDGDGVANSAEWIAGTSAGDSNDCLRLSIEPAGQSGARLHWNAKANRVYNVWKCTNLKQGFSRIGGDVAVPSNDSLVNYDDTHVDGPVY